MSWLNLLRSTMLDTYIVEDNPIIRDNLIEMLEEIANVRSVGSAQTEEDAVKELRSPDALWRLVIVDLFLANGSGLGVLKALALRPASRWVVVLSNYATPEMRRQCLALGADAFFDKSSEIEELVTYCLARSECLS